MKNRINIAMILSHAINPTPMSPRPQARSAVLTLLGAWVGRTEEEVKATGRAYKTGSFPFAASGRAKAMEQTSGMVKIISATDDDEILGVHIIGPMAGELIAEAVLAMEFAASTEDLQRTIHAHPSLAEAMHEASLAVDKRALNYPN